jgi:hypothetical protein
MEMTMAKHEGGLGDGTMPGGRDEGIGPTGPAERDEAARKGSDVMGAPSPDPRAKRNTKPAEEGARIDETPDPNE